MPFDPNAPFTVKGFDPTQPYEVVEPKDGRTFGEAFKDTAIDAAKGVVGLGEGAVGLADIVTGNLAGKGLTYLGYDPKATNEILSDQYSDQRKAANKAVADADGFWDTISALVDNPSVAFGSIIESAPMSIGGAGVARAVAVRMLGAALAENGIAAGSTAAKQFAAQFFGQPAVQASIVRAGAVAEGAQTAGSIQEHARQNGREWSDSVLPAVAAGAGTAVIGVGSSKIPGFRDAEATVATAGLTARNTGTGVVTAAKEIGKSMVKEGALEEMPQSAQEQALTNVAMGEPWEQDIGDSAALGLIVGAAQGGGMTTVSEAINAVQPARVTPIDKNKPSNLGVVAANISEADREQAENEAVAESFGRIDATIDSIHERVTGRPVDPTPLKEVPEDAFTANRGKPFVSESALRANARIKGVDLAGHDIARTDGGFVAVPKESSVPEAEDVSTAGDGAETVSTDGVGDFPADWRAAGNQTEQADIDEDALIPRDTPIGQLEDEYGRTVADVVKNARAQNLPISLRAAIEMANSSARTQDDHRQVEQGEKQIHSLSDNVAMTLSYLRRQAEPVHIADIEGRAGKGKAVEALFAKGLARLGEDGTIETVGVGESSFAEPFNRQKADKQQEAAQEGTSNAERHEVIDNTDSLAHGQEMNTAPSKEQTEAGNYKKAHNLLDGLAVSIENPVGTTRSGTGKDGKAWQTEMKADYGYIKGSKGFDKDHVDLFVTPGYQGGAEYAFVINQFGDGGKGEFDEHKVVIGAKSEAEAMDIYTSNYEAGWQGGRHVTAMPMEEFKEWAKSDGPQAGALMQNNTQAAYALQRQEPAAGQDQQAERNTFPATKKQAVLAQLRRRVPDERKEFPGMSKEIQTTKPFTEKDARRAFPGISKELAGAEPFTVADGRREFPGTTGAGMVTPAAQPPTGETKHDIVEHVTKKGKTLRGSIRKGLTEEQAKAIDPYSWKKDGGWFIREKHLKEAQNETQAEEERAGAIPERPEIAGTSKGESATDSVTNTGVPDQGTDKKGLRVDAASENISGLKTKLFEARRQAKAALKPEAKAKAEAKVEKIESTIRKARARVFDDEPTLVIKSLQTGKEEELKLPPREKVEATNADQEWFDTKGEFSLDGAREQLRRLEESRREFERGEAAKNRTPVLDDRKEQKIREAKALVVRLEAEQTKAKETGQLSTPDQIKALSDNDLAIDTEEHRNITVGQIETAGGIIPESSYISSDNVSNKEEPNDDKQISGDNRGVSEKEQSGRTRPAERRGDSSGVSGGSGRGLRGPGRADNSADDGGVAGRVHAEGAGTQSGEVRGAGGNDAGSDRVFGQSENYRITNEDNLGKGGAKAKAKANIRAIEILREQQASGRPATREQQAALVKYVGWGASELANSMFPKRTWDQGQGQYVAVYKEGWEALGKKLKELLKPKEYAEAQGSTLNAHYTSQEVIQAMYRALARFGYDGKGRVLEPGSGIGNFIGLLPDAFSQSRFTGVEMDPTTAGIAKLLYPKHDIRNIDFAEFKAPNDFYDVAIGNPPFLDVKVTNDPDYAKNGFLVHDFFFAKAIDKVRPGGLMMLVTSKGTMDKANDKARAYLSKRADLIGAIRLPQTAFKENAGTEVVTDVIFLRKRKEGEPYTGESWSELQEVETKDGDGVYVNEYFANHPEMVLGYHSTQGSMYGPNQYTVEPKKGAIGELFDAAVKSLPENIYQQDIRKTPTTAESIEVSFAPGTVKEGGFFLNGENVLQKDNGVGLPVAASGIKKQLLVDFVKVRDAARDLLYAQMKDGGADLTEAQARLHEAYDGFVQRHGPINKVKSTTRTLKDGTESTTTQYLNFRHFKSDPDAYLVASLERYNAETGKAEKADIFTQRVISPAVEPAVETLIDALHVSLYRTGQVDIGTIAGLMNVSEDEAIAGLEGLIYRDPNGNSWVTSDEYLSGNVRAKLAEARAAAEIDTTFRKNIEALEKVQPEDLPRSEIKVNLGMPILDPDHIQDFARDVIDMGIKATYLPQDGSWSVKAHSGQATAKARSDYGTARMGAEDLLDAALNGRSPKVYDLDDNNKPVLNKDATQAAIEKLATIKTAFREWLWKDEARAEIMARRFNDLYNNTVKREFGGDYIATMQFPGMSQVKRPFDHQKRVAWRIIQRGNTYMAHSVGAGKTIASIMSGMEMKRLGIKKKPMWAVPNHMLKQFAAEFLELYPAAKILVADEEQFSKENRNRFMGRVAAENWDGIIITHSAFGMIPMSADFQQQFIDEQLQELDELLQETRGDHMKRKQIERLKKRLQARLAKILASASKDKGVGFEETGIDQIFVDEAHEFRKLDFATNQTNIKGIDPDGSLKAFDLYVKSRYLETLYPNRSLVLMSGTPVTNTLGEIYSVQRFMQEGKLRELGLQHFDSWAATFGAMKTEIESTPAGYKSVSRFNDLSNVPALSTMWADIGDFIQAKSLIYLKRPKVKGGGRILVLGESSDLQRQYKKDLGDRIREIESRRRPPQKGDDIILSVITDGRHAALDDRYIDPLTPERKDSKMSLMLEKAFGIWEKTTDARSTQMIFCDLGMPGSVEKRGFSVYSHIKRELIDRGVPEREIAFMQDYKKSDQKKKLFEAMNTGEVRFLIGSSQAMGTGVNAQKKLIALHHFDPDTYLPSNIEQREGRIVRQGNENPEVEIYAYATRGSYDETMWQFLESKQRFIDDFLAGNASAGESGDIDGAADQFAMARAMSSDNPLAIELAGVQNELSRLKSLAQAHKDDQRTLKSNKEYAAKSIGWAKERIAKLEDAVSRKVSTKGDAFRVTIGGKDFSDRTKVGEALLSRMKKDFASKGESALQPRKVGAIGGYDIWMQKKVPMGFAEEVTLFIHDGPAKLAAPGIIYTEGGLEGQSPSGLSMRLENSLKDFESSLVSEKAAVVAHEKTISEAEERIGRPFEHQASLDEKLKREGEIIAELSAQDAEERRRWQEAQGQTGEESPKVSMGDKPLLVGEAADIEAAIGAAGMDDLLDSGMVEVITADEARARVSGNPGADVMKSEKGRIQGIVSKDGKISLVQGGIRQGKVLPVLTHELGVHVGRILATEMEFKAALRNIEIRSGEQSETGKAIREAFARVPQGTKPEHVTEEALAYLVEAHPETTLARRVIALVKRLLVKMGISPDIFKAADFRALAEVAVRVKVIEAKSQLIKQGREDNDTRFSISDDSPLSAGSAESPMYLESLEETAKQMGSITFIKNSKPDSTFLDRIFSTPEYYFKKFAAGGRVLQAALARRDIRFVKEQEILGGFVKYVQKLRENNKDAYDEANDHLIAIDQGADGFRIKSQDDDTFRVLNPKWALSADEIREADEGISKSLSPERQSYEKEKTLKEKLFPDTFHDEAEAIAAMIEAEQQALLAQGYSPEAAEAVKLARELTNRGFDIMAADMRKIIDEAKENGLPDPFIGDGALDESGRYGIYVAGKKQPIALFSSQAEAEQMLKQAAQAISYMVFGSRKGERSFATELQANRWVAKHSGTVKGQPMFRNLVVKKRTDAEMRPLTVKQALAQMGDLRGVFFPRIREAGEYVLIARRDGVNPIRRHFDVPMVGDKHPTVQAILGGMKVGGIHFGLPIAVEARKLKAMGYTVTVEKDKSPAEDIFDATNLVSSLDAILQDSMQTIDKNNQSDVKAGQHINQILTMQIADIFKSRGYLSSRLKRLAGDVVWEGYEEDMGRALTQYGKNVAAGTAKRDTARAMILAFSGRDYSWAEYKREVEKPDWAEYQEIVEKRRIDPRTQKNLFRDVRSFMVDVLRNDDQTDRIMGVMKGLAVLKYLGFRVSSAAVNMTNMVQGVPATMAGLTGESIHKAFGRVTAAAVAYGKHISGKGDLSEEDRGIFRYISGRGWDEAQFNHEAARELRSKLGESWKKFMAASMFVFGAAEKANRAMTLFAAYKAVRKEGSTATDDEVAWEKAKEISDRAHGVYGKETIPAWARGKLNPLRLTYTFQKFSHNYMLNMLDLGFNRKEYKAAAYMLLSPAILAGAGASLAGPVLFAMAGALGVGGDDPEEEWYKRMEKVFGAGEFARHGLFGVAGINIKGSLAMNLPMPADIGKVKLIDLAGPAGGVVTDIGKGFGHLAHGELFKGVEFLLPTAFGSAFKASREATEGITTSNYGTVFYGDEPLKADAMDAFLRFLSFNPARLSGIREKQWHEKEVAARYQEEKTEIYAQIKRLHLQGRGITPEILKTVKWYNDRMLNSGRQDISPITPKSIRTMLRRNGTASKVERMRVAN